MPPVSTTAAVLEPDRVRPQSVEQAMQKVASAASSSRRGANRVYGAVVYGRREGRPDYVGALGRFFRAYLRGLRALSGKRDTLLKLMEKNLRAVEAQDNIRFLVGHAAPDAVRSQMQASPGTYIIPSHLDIGLLRDLGLPLVPEALRGAPLVIEVAEPLKETAPSVTWGGWDKPAAEPREDSPVAEATLEWRKRFMAKNHTFTSAQVAEESTSQAANRAAIASRWVAEKKIFAVDYAGQKQFPDFQFRHGRPIPAVADVIKAFPDQVSGWELAYFFTAPNPYIGGREPRVLLQRDPSRVVSLARAFAHPADVF
jgi:hypothetical protein